MKIADPGKHEPWDQFEYGYTTVRAMDVGQTAPFLSQKIHKTVYSRPRHDQQADCNQSGPVLICVRLGGAASRGCR
jgi:hypothetical protein